MLDENEGLVSTLSYTKFRAGFKLQIYKSGALELFCLSMKRYKAHLIKPYRSQVHL